MKKTKPAARLLALLLTLGMVFGQQSLAFAASPTDAVPEAEQTAFETEADAALTETPAEEALPEQEGAGAASDEEGSAQEGSDEGELPAAEPEENDPEEALPEETGGEAVSDEAGADEAVTVSEDAEGAEEGDVSADLLDQFEFSDGAPEQFPSPGTGAEIKADEDFTVGAKSKYVTVKNNRASGGESFYVALVNPKSDESEARLQNTFVNGVEVAPGSTVSLSIWYDLLAADWKSVEAESSYRLLLGELPYLSAYEYEYEDESGEKQKYVYYQGEAEVTTLPASEAEAAQYEDGYTKITLKANQQKNQSVKFSWKPDTKDELQKTFKKYALFQINKDGSGWEQIWPDRNGKLGTGKSATLKKGVSNGLLNYETKDWVYDEEKQDLVEKTVTKENPLIFLLKCYNKDASSADAEPLKTYLTVAAPFMVSVQNEDSSEHSFEYSFTSAGAVSSQFYRLEIAKKNKEGEGVAKPDADGFKESVSKSYLAADLASITEYPMAKNVTSTLMVASVGNILKTDIGTKYFFRARSVYYYEGVKYVSAPSNVLNIKAGPSMCYVMDIAGVKYDKTKSSQNKTNAIEHMKWYLGYGEEVAAEGADSEENAESGEGSESEEGRSESKAEYCHTKDKGTDAKSGMVFFVGPTNGIKTFDLLRSESRYGTYKKIKSFNPDKNTEIIWKCSVDGFEPGSGMALWCMEYNSFVPEKEYYYAVRAVSSAGSAPGGYGNTEYNKTELDKVQNFGTIGSSQKEVTMGWTHDDCVKQYWIYRTEVAAKPKDASDFTRIATVSGSKSYYMDKKAVLGTVYYYYVRPVYDTKAAKKSEFEYNADLCSDWVTGESSVDYAMVKKLTSSNYSTGCISLAWPMIGDGVTEYRISRIERTYEFDAKSVSEDDANWMVLRDVTVDGVSKKETKEYDSSVTVGRYYLYRIQPKNGDKLGKISTYAKTTRAAVLAPTISAAYNGSRRAKVTVKLNAKDSAIWSEMKVYLNGELLSGTGQTRTYYDNNVGTKKTYTAYAQYKNVDSASVKVVYGVATHYLVRDNNGNKLYTNDRITMKVGETRRLSVTGYMSSDEKDSNKAPMADYNVWSSNSSVARCTREGDDNPIDVKIEARQKGEARLRVYDNYSSREAIYLYITVVD
ncbi:MAG: hypothetical protein IJU50_01510 [Lachnospiraceae bacterium]|nr:hypothetical protein [Lachnospiraceae bacterium]